MHACEYVHVYFFVCVFLCLCVCVCVCVYFLSVRCTNFVINTCNTGSLICTDTGAEFDTEKLLRLGYKHSQVDHSRKQWVDYSYHDKRGVRVCVCVCVCVCV